MAQVKVQFYTDEITVAVVDNIIDRYKESAKKTEVYSRLMLLGIQVVNDLGLDLSNESECAALALDTLTIDYTEYSKADAASDRILPLDDRSLTGAMIILNHSDGLPW